MMKLLYPDGVLTDEEAYELIDFAAECRKRVKDQLYLIDETFKAEPAKFKYVNVKTGATVPVETLERVEYQSETPEWEKDEANEASASSVSPDEAAQGAKGSKRPRIPQLVSRQINIRMNQKGVTWKSLLGEYLATAKKVVVTDPFVRVPHQITNFVELVQAIQDASTAPEELSIELHTQTDNDEQAASLIDIFQELQEDFAPRGIEFSWYFDAVHDRSIVLDNGWSINLGRGLDIYEKYSRWSLSNARPEKRSCKEFTVSIVKR
jgi:ATP-dependent Lon protease